LKGSSSQPAPFVGSEFPEADFERLCALLLARRGFDLGMYKERCVKRRIAARVRSCGFHAAPPYLARLETDEAELDALLAAITINVSQFFRNPSTFQVLERQVLPALVRQARTAGERRLRLWSVGCASGEEPYSLALLAEGLQSPELEIEIWASDLSAPVLDRAVAGYYDEQRLIEVPETLRAKYFVAEGDGYRLGEKIRRRVRFQQQDILGEGAFPRASLVLCRNVLIYFSRADQERILRRFAATLEPGGYLVLGRAEILLGEIRELFAVEHPDERIFRCVAGA
jgi:chemotaxis protein methyltransferase CheR